jgi:signal transduction histidine kinase
MPDLMFVLDAKGKYVDFHARDSKSLFTSPDRFLGRNVRDVMPPALAGRFMDAIEQALTTDDTVVVHYDLPTDELRHFEARLVPADNGCVVSIVRDVTEAKRARELNRTLAGRIIVSQEEERQRIARELHDDLSQKIALLNLEVDQIADEVPVDVARTPLARVSSQVNEIANDLSDLSHKLHPSRLQTLGLIESVRLLCSEISQQRQVDVRFSAAELGPAVDPNAALCLYRITQEALHNVAKHSQARHASVHLACEGNHVHLQIADSGVGFDPVAIESAGLGLVSMKERVGVLKGHLVIHAAPGGGTSIEVRLPLTPPARRARRRQGRVARAPRGFNRTWRLRIGTATHSAPARASNLRQRRRRRRCPRTSTVRCRRRGPSDGRREVQTTGRSSQRWSAARD